MLCESNDIDWTAKSVHPHETKESGTFTPLHMSVKGRDLRIVEHKLHKAFESLNPESFHGFLNGKDEVGMTALHHAAWEGCEDIVSELLNYQDVIDVNVLTNGGYTALHLASWHNYLRVINNLLAHPQIDFERRSWRRLQSVLRTVTLKDQKTHLVRLSEVRRKTLLQVFMEQGRVEVAFLQLFLGKTAEAYRECKQVADFEHKLIAQLQNLANDGGRREPRVTVDMRMGPIVSLKFGEKLRGGFESFLFGEGIAALHCAALAGHSTIVVALVKGITSKQNARRTLNALGRCRMTPLHYAGIGGDVSTVEELSTNSMVRGNVEEELKGLTPLDIAFVLFHEARRRMKEEYKVIISLLSEQLDVRSLKETLHRDRQIFVDAANAILVGAVLIASVTFAGWLQPPLGYQPYYETRYILTGLAPPDTFGSLATVAQHPSVQVFWILNSLSFFFAIAAVFNGASPVLPSQAIVGKAAVGHIRTLLIRTTLMLSISMFFVLGAFIAAFISTHFQKV